MKNDFDQSYWQKRWENMETQWDTGEATLSLKEYFKSLTNKDLSVVVPGAGNAHEGLFLKKMGFENVTILDIAEDPISSVIKSNKEFNNTNALCEDWFEHKGQYDLIIEQTFFCALHPSKRESYAKHASKLLKPGGRLVGLLFDFPLTETGPPFGGSTEEYISYFREDFEIEVMERCYNSIKPRMGSELFINLRKK